MPQLNPAPWLPTFIITWLMVLMLLKLMVTLHDPSTPTKAPTAHPITAWIWTWL